MAEQIPIVCFHLGAHPYVSDVMAQALDWNPDAPIYLLTEQPASRFSGINVLPVLEYSKEAIEFQKYYTHMSSNSYDIELMCLQRWLVISEALRSIPTKRCFVMDSDVLLYCNIAATNRKYSDSLFTLTHQMSPGECFFDVDVIHKLAEAIKFTYRERTNRLWYMIDAWYRYILASGEVGGISDMAILSLFSHSYAGRWEDAMKIVDGATFDHHINTGYPNFETEDGRKKISWRDNQPYGYQTERKEWIRFRSLHFQGNAKPLIANFVRNPLPESILD